MLKYPKGLCPHILGVPNFSAVFGKVSTEDFTMATTELQPPARELKRVNVFVIAHQDKADRLEQLLADAARPSLNGSEEDEFYLT